MTSISANINTHSKCRDLIIHKELAHSSYTIYLVSSKNENTQYAMKVFPYKNEQIDDSYMKEIHISSFSHPNIISIVEAKGKVKTNHGDSSYILMEFAKHGDLAEKLYSKKMPRDELVTRTYFHQMVSAIEYLHSNKIAHMDLKTDNFLIARDYSLKLSDFDMSMQIEGKDRLTRGGTSNYRAPEILINRVKDPKACDMYALGVTLFTMMFNCFPYIEDSEDKSLQESFVNGKKEFWMEHPATKNSYKFLDRNFMGLIMGLVRSDAAARYTIDDIKKNSWFMGKTYNKKEMIAIMSKVL